MLFIDALRNGAVELHEGITMAGRFQNKYVQATIETLRNIASQVKARSAKQLEASDALAEDLGYDSRELENLAVWQRQAANALRKDGKRTVIRASHFEDKTVGQVLGETIKRSTGVEYTAAELAVLIAEAKEAL